MTPDQAAPSPSGPAPALTVASEQRDFADWRQGRTHYAVWAINIDVPSLDACIARMRRHLDDYLLPGYCRQPHITLRICGFPSAERGYGDDFTPAACAAQLKALEAARLPPFAIEIGAPRSFTSAAYFSVRDDAGGIARLRQALGSAGPGERDLAFVPHLTFGLYRGQFPVPRVMQRMLSCPGLQDIPVRVNTLALMTYEAAVIGGPLSTVCEFDLEQQALRVPDARAFVAARGRWAETRGGPT